MAIVPQVMCPRCRETNYAYLTVCVYCGEGLSAAPMVRTAAFVLPPQPASDLPPLLWALTCFFLAIFGLIFAGPLRPLLGILTHPYLLIGAAAVSLIVTGVYLAERFTHEHRPRTLLSSCDLMALSWTCAALLGASQILKYVVPPMPVITHYEKAPGSGDGCRIEVYLKGEEGDELWRLTGLNGKSEKEVVGVIVRRPGGGSARLPMTKRTPQGDCDIVKYHLVVNGKEVDSIER